MPVKTTGSFWLNISKQEIFTWKIPALKTSRIRRWAPWLALVIIFAIATSLLSWWQFSRREEAVNKINLVLENYDAKTIDFSELDWELDANGNASSEWQSVRVSGHYLPQLTTLVRNRPLAGSAGFLQLVPFQIQGGQILIVERGWIMAASRVTDPSSNPLPDDKERQITVRLRPSEMDLNREAVPGQVASINLATLAELFAAEGEVITSYYGRISLENPPTEALLTPMPKPSLNEGNHLSYALQWIIFGLMAFFAFFWAYRNEKRTEQEKLGLIAPKIKRKTQADFDAQIEDAKQ